VIDKDTKRKESNTMNYVMGKKEKEALP